MLDLLIAHAALGGVLGLGSRAPALLLPSVAALLEGFLVAAVCGYSFLIGSALSFALLLALQASFVLGSLAEAPTANGAAS